MTLYAWLMLACTWAIVVFFTTRFLLAVIRKPPRGGAEPAGMPPNSAEQPGGNDWESRSG